MSQAKGLVPLWDRRTCTSSPCGVENTFDAKKKKTPLDQHTLYITRGNCKTYMLVFYRKLKELQTLQTWLMQVWLEACFKFLQVMKQYTLKLCAVTLLHFMHLKAPFNMRRLHSPAVAVFISGLRISLSTYSPGAAVGRSKRFVADS